MNKLVPITIFALTMIFQSGAADAQIRVWNDTTKPTLSLTMNDGKNAGPIILREPGVWPRTDLPRGVSARLGALGCNGSYYEGNWDPGWSEIYAETDFFNPWIQDQTYFFRELREGSQPSDFVPYSFTLRASDTSGIKKILVRIRERDVVPNYTNPLLVADDGPTEFINVSPSRAVPQFLPIYYRGEPFFRHYEKQLLLEPRATRLGSIDSVLHFDLTDFGIDAKIRIDVEDNGGNVSSGSVYLADDRLCHE